MQAGFQSQHFGFQDLLPQRVVARAAAACRTTRGAASRAKYADISTEAIRWDNAAKFL
jgi:hypothetical protein